MAVSFHKLVAERGGWDEDLLRDGEIAWMSNAENGKEIAMLKWWMAAERGSEIAQDNLAYTLDQGFILPNLLLRLWLTFIYRQEYLAPDALLTYDTV